MCNSRITQALSGGTTNAVQSAMDTVVKQNPVMAGHGWQGVDSRGKPSQYGGSIEFYPPDEEFNPRPGAPTVEVFDPKLKGDSLNTAVYGDMLHHMPRVDPAFRQMREEYRQSMTPEQLDIDHRAYNMAKGEYGEARSFPDWHDQSRLDAHVRGYLAPDANNDWRDAYTPVQRAILGRMQTHLRTGQQSLP